MNGMYSLSYNLNPIDELVAETFSDFSNIPPESRFHLIKNGEHFELVATVQQIIIQNEKGVIIDRDQHLTVEQFPTQNPRALDQYHLLQIGTSLPKEVIHKNTRFTFSRELQNGVEGHRDEAHRISPALLLSFLKKKHWKISKQRKQTHLVTDKLTNQVVNIELRFQKDYELDLHCTVLTAYYLNAYSIKKYESWKQEFSKI